MRHRVALLLALPALAALAMVGGCAVEREPLRPVRSATAVVCRSLSARDVAEGRAPSVADLAARGAAALVARPVREAEPIAAQLARAGVLVVQAGDAGQGVEAVDAVVARVAKEHPGEAVLVVSEPSAERHGLAVVAGGPVASGLLGSTNAHLPGVLAADDLAVVAAVLSGRAEAGRVWVAPRQPRAAMAELAREETFYRAARAAQAPLIVAFALVAGVSVLGLWALAAVESTRVRARYWHTAAYRALLFALCLPPATVLARFVERHPSDPARILVVVLGIAGALWLAFLAASERHGPAVGLLAACVLTAAVVAADQLAGGPLAPGTAFSYAPLDGFRFYGIGNEGAAVLAGSWLAASALTVSRGNRARRLGVAVVSGLCAIAVASAPVFGANSAVALWGTVVAGVFLVEATRGKVRVRDAAGIGAAAACAFALVFAVEGLTGARTHVGSAVAAGAGGVLDAVVRRGTAVVHAYAAHPSALVGFAAWGLLAWVRVRPPGPLGRAMDAWPSVRAAASAALAGGAVAALVEDSSVIVMVLLALYAGAVLGVATQSCMRGGT